MRVARERLIFLALCALDEFADQAKEGPVPPPIGVRLALAFLWAFSNGTNRGSYEGFWRNLTPRKGPDYRPMVSYKERHVFARHQFNGIVQSLGLDFEEVQRRINRVRGKPPGYRPVPKTWEAMTDEEKRERSRRARYCDLQKVNPFPKDERI